MHLVYLYIVALALNNVCHFSYHFPRRMSDMSKTRVEV